MDVSTGKRARRPKLTEAEKAARAAARAAEREADRLEREWGRHSSRGLLLLALRAGPMCADQIVARFGAGMAATKAHLIDLGLVVLRDGYAWITEAGRARCPNRAG